MDIDNKNSFKKGDKVLVRVMECTNDAFDQWDVVYKTAVISQESVISLAEKTLCTVCLANGKSEHVWSNHILQYPKEWLDSKRDLC